MLRDFRISELRTLLNSVTPSILCKKLISYACTCDRTLSFITRASFCCIKKLKKLHLFLTKVAKSCIYSQTLKTTVIYSSDLFAYYAKYLQTLLGEKWRFFANSLRSMLKLRFTVHEVVSKLLRHK